MPRAQPYIDNPPPKPRATRAVPGSHTTHIVEPMTGVIKDGRASHRYPNPFCCGTAARRSSFARYSGARTPMRRAIDAFLLLVVRRPPGRVSYTSSVRTTPAPTEHHLTEVSTPPASTRAQT